MAVMENRTFISYEEAVSLLPDGDVIHTFRSSNSGIILGADWDRENLLNAIKTYKPELSGKIATKLGHGLCIIDEVGHLFIETKRNEDEKTVADKS